MSFSAENDDLYSSVELFTPPEIPSENEIISNTDDDDEPLGSTTTVENVTNVDTPFSAQTECSEMVSDATSEQPLVDEIVSFTYSLQTSSPMTTSDDSTLLIQAVESVVHESVANDLLQYCLNDETTSNSENRLLIRRVRKLNQNRILASTGEVKPRSISSAPADSIAEDQTCEAKSSENGCIVVQSAFTVSFDGDMNSSDAASQIEQSKLDALMNVNRNMKDKNFLTDINAKLLQMGSNSNIQIANLEFRENVKKEKSSNTAVGVTLPLLFIFLGSCAFWMYRKGYIFKKGSKELDDHNKNRPIAHILNDGYDIEKPDNDKDDVNRTFDTISSMDSANYTSQTSDSLATYSAEQRPDLDVHKCASAYCMTCRKLGRKANFKAIDTQETKPEIEFSTPFSKDWWKNDEGFEMVEE